MKRSIFCIILLSLSTAIVSSSAFAEALYRWIEPDGSITFSPNPPPKGIKFTKVNSASAAATQSGQSSPLASTEQSLAADASAQAANTESQVNDTKILSRPAAAIASPKLSYAPETSSDRTFRKPTEADVSAATEPAPRNPTKRIVASDKRQQCNDLSKRVVSLERRLRTALAPDDMDNTVMAMARYQRSFDQYCL